MSPVMVHYSLTLDLAGNADIDATVNQFLQQANLSKIKKSVETIGNKCIIRFDIEGPETLAELQQTYKSMNKGLFSEVTLAAIKPLKELPSDLYLDVTARPPLFGLDDGGRYSPSFNNW